MGIESVACPACGATTQVGVPQGGAVVEATDDPPDDGADTEGEKHRTVACPEGHEFGVRFTVG
jgi:hypothetical protein